ncbi:MAG: L,D-transpeptidase family protein [Planctomycetota bacterium]
MPSQSARPGMTRGGMTSRRRGLGKLPKLLALLGVAALLVWFFWGGDAPAPGNATAPGTGGAPNGTAAATPDPPRVESVASTDLVGLPTLDQLSRNPPPEMATPPPAVETPTAEVPEPPAPATPKPQADPGPTPQPDPTLARAQAAIAEALPTPRRFTSGGDAATLYNRGDRLIAEGDLVEGRNVLSRLLLADDLRLGPADADAVRARLDEVNQTLFWSPDVAEGDPVASLYQNDGAFLSQIGVKHRVPYGLLERINQLDARNLRGDHVLKVVQGPLHARVTKSRFIMDVYALTPDGEPVYLTHFPVGLGEDDKTPPGNWQVTKASKVTNPSWRDDENNQFYAPDDPENPIGEFWIAIHGLDASNRGKRGFGIHGTIEPDSIGQEASRGCIRLADGDIDLVFDLLTDHSQGSTLRIVP